MSAAGHLAIPPAPRSTCLHSRRARRIIPVHPQPPRPPARRPTAAHACSDDDVRLARRIQRDVAHRGRNMADVIAQYTRFVKPSHDDYIAPSKRAADLIIPWHRGDNLVAVDLIVGHLKSHIVNDVLLSEYPNLHLVESTFQMRGMHTIIRDRTTPKGEFIFMADRLIRLVRAHARPGAPRCALRGCVDAADTRACCRDVLWLQGCINFCRVGMMCSVRRLGDESVLRRSCGCASMHEGTTSHRRRG